MKTIHPGLSISNRNFTITLSCEQASRVILSVPHDCFSVDDFPGLFGSRRNGATVADLFVWRIAIRILDRCLHAGINIDAVRSLMPRMYVDMNRSLTKESNLDPKAVDERAIGDVLLNPVFKEYHGSLGYLIRRSIQKFGVDHVLLLDLHGFGRQPDIAPSEGYDLILGTANRRTVRHGSPDIDFSGYMFELGYRIFLPRHQAVVPSGDPFDSGHITRLYAKKYGINAIQIEISSTFRRLDIRKDARERGQKLAQDIAEFLSVHYK